jgi:hypothetical protein
VAGLEQLVATARRRLRLRRILVAIERNPQLLEIIEMAIDIRRPMELAGLKSRMERAKRQEAAIEVTGMRYDQVQDRIDELHDAARGHVGSLEMQEHDLRRQIESMVGGSNGAPNDGPASSAVSSEDGQTITSTAAAER